MIYLDNNATTAIDRRVLKRMAEDWAIGPSNASSLHAAGRDAQTRIDQATAEIAAALGTRLGGPGDARLIYTSGGTESNNLALRGIEPDAPLIVSAIEHASVIEVAGEMAATGRDVHFASVDRYGRVDTAALADLIERVRPGLVSVMSANNETGVIEPIEAVAAICRDAGVRLHVDATQSIGKTPVRLADWDVAAVTFTAHKFHGPAGCGALWLAPGVMVETMIRGGGQQLESRGGTEPVSLIVAMAAALRWAVDELDVSAATMRDHRDRLENELLKRHGGLSIHGGGVERLPGTTCLSFPGADRQSMLMALDMAGIACSSGAACSSGSSPPSHVLTAMGCPDAEIESALRFGVSKFSTESEVSQAIDSISRIYNRLRPSEPVEN